MSKTVDTLKIKIDASEVRQVIENVLAELSIPVNAIQPADDCPGAWIEFKSDEDRERALKLFRVNS